MPHDIFLPTYTFKNYKNNNIYLLFVLAHALLIYRSLRNVERRFVANYRYYYYIL